MPERMMRALEVTWPIVACLGAFFWGMSTQLAEVSTKLDVIVSDVQDNKVDIRRLEEENAAQNTFMAVLKERQDIIRELYNAKERTVQKERKTGERAETEVQFTAGAEEAASSA